MIEDFVGDMGRNAQPGHPRHAGPTQIMKPPSGHSRELIQPTLGWTESLEELGSELREDICFKPPKLEAERAACLGA
jgi:hypothetical protein